MNNDDIKNSSYLTNPRYISNITLEMFSFIDIFFVFIILTTGKMFYEAHSDVFQPFYLLRVGLDYLDQNLKY